MIKDIFASRLIKSLGAYCPIMFIVGMADYGSKEAIHLFESQLPCLILK